MGILKDPLNLAGVGNDGCDVSLKKEVLDLPGLVLIFDQKVQIICDTADTAG